MPNEFKVSAYVALSVIVATCFFYCLRPYLLQSPPNSFALAVVGIALALLLYAMIAGPVFIIRMNAAARRKMRQAGRLGFWAFLVGALLGLALPSVPQIVPATFACYALVILLLIGFAKYVPRYKVSLQS